MHRYSEFASLHEFLEVHHINNRCNSLVIAPVQTSNISIPIPPKKVFGGKDKEVIAERQKGLQVSREVNTVQDIVCYYFHRPFLIPYCVNHCSPVHGRSRGSLTLLHIVKILMVYRTVLYMKRAYSFTL